MKFHCCDPRRLDVLSRSGSQNAIAFLEVLDRAAPPGVPAQRTLFVRLLRPLPAAFERKNLRITGGERIPQVGISWCAPADQLPPEAEPGLVDTVDDLTRTLVVRTESAGDFSTYILAIVAGAASDAVLAGFDPRLSSIAFSFKVECPSDFDCAAAPVCPPAAAAHPQIDYLAKDYQGLRRLMLDRLSLLVPGWAERSEADVGIALVELLAYAADNLSYRQDAIASEAYLSTARQRVSVRRHARLVDYWLHEGCNARAWVCLSVAGANIALPKGTPLLTRTPGLPTEVAPDSRELREALTAGALVFETAHDATLHSQLNTLHFYTWGDGGCSLPRGSTRATLRERLDALQVGDVLVFEEVVSPTTFKPADADRTRRWAVRLTTVTLTEDPSGKLFEDPSVDGPVDITEIGWDAADALPFALCLSVATKSGVEISVAHGNVVLADHGMTVSGERLGEVPEPSLFVAARTSGVPCVEPLRASIPARFRPMLLQGPLSHGFELDTLLELPIGDNESWWPASSLLDIDPRAATPLIDAFAKLNQVDQTWTPRRDLLQSGGSTPDFVVEVEDDGLARLRFGDDVNGKRPDPKSEFHATYRVGNGAIGNVGAEAIAHVVSNGSGVFSAIPNPIRNPMPAAGGVDPEEVEVARRDAPEAFRTQERAVTTADYAAAAERRPDVQRAAAKFRWTGSWYTAFVAVDRFGREGADARFVASVRRHLERFRMAGYDLAVRAPRYVALDVALHVCVRPDYFRANVIQAVERALSANVLPDGTLGAFHPDNFSFGDEVYLSRIIAAAQAIEGVDSVRADRFQRLADPSPTTLEAGVIPMGNFEIAQLANTPNFRERGRISLSAGGGK
jgi:hypothetical protein